MGKVFVVFVIQFILLFCNITYAQTWQQVPLRTQAQKTAKLSGGEGMQMIQDLVYAPTDGNVIYMSTDTSQVWKSEDGGATWAPKNNGISSVGVVAITVSPYDADIVFACGFMNNQSTNEERGLFKTINGGDSWTLVLAKTLITNSQRGSDPVAFASATIIYAGDGTGKLWKSTDTGATWSQIATIGTSIWDVKINPADSTILFVCSNNGYKKVVDSGGVTVTSLGSLPANPTKTVVSPTTSSTMYVCIPGYGIYKSTNTGVSFSAVNSGFHTGLAGGPKYLSISPVSGGSDLLYCSFGTPSGGSYLGKMYYSNNGGGNWVTPTAMDTQNADGWVCGSLRDSNAAVSTSSGSPIATHPTTKNTAFAVVGYHLMVKTTDGGGGWSNTTAGGNTGYTGALSGQTAFNGRGDITSIAFDTNNSNRYIFSNADYGNYLTTDGGSTFSRLTAVGNCRGTVIDPVADSQILLSITSPSGYFTNYIKRSTNEGTSWTQVGGDGRNLSFIMFDAADSNKVYTNWFKSTDKGITWSAFADTAKKIASVYKQGTHIYATTLSGSTLTLWRSSDGGVTWTRNTVGNPAVQYPTTTANPTDYYGQITVAPDDPDKIYIAQSSLGLWRINGVSGTLTTLPLSNYPYRETVVGSGYNRMDLSTVVVDPNDSDVVYVGKYSPYGYTAESIFRSKDGGVTFTDISGNLKYTFATSITVNPHDSYVYVGGHHGTWKLPPPGVAGTGTVGTAPSVTTGTATVITVTTATFHAEVNPNGPSTTASFQYGTSPGSYTVSTGSQTVGAGTSSVGVQQAITGLSGSTTYYGRCRANSANGSTNGSEMTFTTDQRLSLNISMGTPTVNGDLSDWAAITNPISVVISGTATTANGSWAVKWNATGLHFAFVGSDTTNYTDSGNNTYLDDGFEVYVNRDGNLESTTYDGYDYHLGWNRHGTFTRAYAGTTTGIVVGTSSASGGYIIEVTVPWAAFPGGTVPGSGTVIGADVQFNDDIDGGGRDGAKGWNAETDVDSDYFNPSSFGKFVLLGEGGGGGSETTNTRLDNVSSSGLKVWFRLDENTGSSTTDSISGIVGTLTGNATWATGTVGRAITFDGTGDSVTIGDEPLLSGTTTYSFSCFVKIRIDDASHKYIIDNGTGTTRWGLRKNASENLIYTEDSDQYTRNLPIPIATWTRITIVKNGDTGTSTSIYQNNTLDGQVASGVMTTPTGNRYIGKVHSSSGAWDGVIDDVRYYDTALSIQDITDLSTVASVVTGTATSITSTSFILAGTITPGGSSSTQGFFQYGTVSDVYTGTSTYITLGTGSTALALSRTITGLSDSTEYFYRAASWNGAHEIYGSQTSATTSGGDAAIPVGTITANSDATYTTSTGVTLNLSATDDIGVEGYYLSGSTTTPYGTQSGWITVGTNTTYSENIPYTLEVGDGIKTVYVWYKDSVNNVSAMTQDNIVLDTTFPSISVVSPQSQNYTMADGTKALGTTAASVAITGSSIDTNGIGTVTVSNSATATTRTATGTTDWNSTERILPYMDDGLVFYANMNDGTGSTQIKDFSRYASHGTPTGTVVGTISVFGLSRYFGGISDNISFSDPSDGHLDPGTKSVSYTAWCTPTLLKGSLSTILSKNQTGADGGYNIYISTGRSFIATLDFTSERKTIISTTLAATGTSYFVAVTVDQSLYPTGTAKLFVNGIQEGTLTSNGTGTLQNSLSFRIGSFANGSVPFGGYIDEARVYNRALSNAEVLQLYQLKTPDQANVITVTAEDVPGNGASDTIAIGAFPSVQTDFATAITRSTALLNGTVNANNNDTTAWFEYGIVSGYYTGSSTTQVVTGSADTAVNISLTSLDNTTTYYYRLVAENTVGKVYGVEYNFDTLPPEIDISEVGSFRGSLIFLGGKKHRNRLLNMEQREDGTYKKRKLPWY